MITICPVWYRSRGDDFRKWSIRAINNFNEIDMTTIFSPRTLVLPLSVNVTELA